jgi:hypothetical protein
MEQKNQGYEFAERNDLAEIISIYLDPNFTPEFMS